MHRVAVTGGNGFIGSVLVRKLAEHDYLVRSLDLAEPSCRISGVEYLRSDICLMPDLLEAFSGVDYVMHLASYSKIKDCIRNPVIAFHVNVVGTLNVLLAARSCGVKRVIYSSSSSAYGNQKTLPFREDMPVCLLNPYASTKFLGESICVESAKCGNVETVALRLFNVFGSELAINGNVDCPSVVEIFLKQKRLGQNLTVIGDGSQRRDLVYVEDVAAAFEAAIERDSVNGEVINIGSGVSYSVAEIAQMVSGETVEVGSRYQEADETLADISKAEIMLCWKPKVKLPCWIQSQLK